MMMESYYMISGDETLYYKNGNPAKESNMEPVIQKAEEALVTATIYWGVKYKEELIETMLQYGVSAIARNKYQYIYPYYADSDEFAFIVIQFNLIPCKEIRIVDKGITIVYPQIYEAVSGTDTYGPLCVNGMKIPFTIKNTTEFVRLPQTDEDDCAFYITEDYFAGYQQFLFEQSEAAIKNALNDYRDLQKDMDLDGCLTSVYDAMNNLEMKLLEKKMSDEQIAQTWSEIVKNIQKAYCRGPLILDVANEADLDQNSELMVDKTAVKNAKIPNEVPSGKEEKSGKSGKLTIDELLKRFTKNIDFPKELLGMDVGNGSDKETVRILPVSIEPAEIPESWEALSKRIQEHNRKQDAEKQEKQETPSREIKIESSPFLNLLMTVLSSHQNDVDD